MEDDVWSMLYLFSGAKMLRFQKDAGESAGSARNFILLKKPRFQRQKKELQNDVTL